LCRVSDAEVQRLRNDLCKVRSTLDVALAERDAVAEAASLAAAERDATRREGAATAAAAFAIAAALAAAERRAQGGASRVVVHELVENQRLTVYRVFALTHRPGDPPPWTSAPRRNQACSDAPRCVGLTRADAAPRPDTLAPAGGCGRSSGEAQPADLDVFASELIVPWHPVVVADSDVNGWRYSAAFENEQWYDHEVRPAATRVVAVRTVLYVMRGWGPAARGV